MIVKQWRQTLLNITLLLLLTSCVNFAIVNVSDLDIRVSIRTPDSSGAYTRFIRAGDSASSFSSYGGEYSVSTLPDSEYRQLLEDLRAEITRRLFEGGATLTADEVAQLVQRLDEIDGAVEEWGNQGDSCSGTAPDFSSVTVVISWSEEQNRWALSCEVAQSDTE